MHCKNGDLGIHSDTSLEPAIHFSSGTGNLGLLLNSRSERQLYIHVIPFYLGKHGDQLFPAY